MEAKLSPLEIGRQLAQCNGSATLSKHYSDSFLYTEGVFLMAEWCGAYWLLDDAGIQAVSLMNQSYFVRIELVKKGDTCTVSYSDGNEKILFQNEYWCSDFPLDNLVLYFTNDTLLLRSEY